MCETYYSILECANDSSYEEIKIKYQQLIKQHHPDKHANKSSELFIKIDEAWKTLRDSSLRKQYDASLLQNVLDSTPLIYAEVNMDDLEFIDNVSYFRCRCGDNFVIEKKFLTNNCIIECSECSNCIIVKNKEKLNS